MGGLRVSDSPGRPKHDPEYKRALPGFQSVNDARSGMKKVAKDRQENGAIRTLAYLGCRAISIIAIPTNILSLFLAIIGIGVSGCCSDYCIKRTCGSAKQLWKSVKELPIVGDICWICFSKQHKQGYRVVPT